MLYSAARAGQASDASFRDATDVLSYTLLLLGEEL